MVCLGSRIVRMAERSKREIAEGNALSEAADGQIMEGLTGKFM